MSDAQDAEPLPPALAIHCQTQHEWLPAAGAPAQLILLLHGWGCDAASMLPLATALRAQFPQAAVLAPDAPQAVDRTAGISADDSAGNSAGNSTGNSAGNNSADNNSADNIAERAAKSTAQSNAPGTAPGTASRADDSPDNNAATATSRQWYSIRKLTPQVWPARVGAALPGLQQWVHAQQQRLGVGAAATCLGGFSQGAILALALASLEDGIAGRVLAFGGCYTAAPAAAPRHTTIHLFHGSADRVIPADGSRNALQWLGELQGDATLDIAEGVGHTLHPVLIGCALQRLQTHIPLRTWQAALGAVPAPRGPADALDD